MLKNVFMTKWQLCELRHFFRLVLNELIHEKTCFLYILWPFNSDILTSFSLLTITVRGIIEALLIAFLAHLSQRLIGELIGYSWSGVRTSSVVVNNFKQLLQNRLSD